MANEDLFVALTECHFMNPQTMSEIDYYPGVARWWGSVDGVMRAWAGRELTGDNEWPEPTAAGLKPEMDRAGVDVCFVLREPMMEVTGHVTSLSTNGFMMQQIEPYPDRMYLEMNCGPILTRGVDHAIWEMEYLHKERNAKLCKVYQPEDLGPINDKRLWPFYEKAQELGIPLTIHTGVTYVAPQPNTRCKVEQVDDVCNDFPDLQIICYHAGWPDIEVLAALCGKHKNLYFSLSGVIGYFERAPYRGYHCIGTAMDWMPSEKIVLGLDLPFDDMKRVIDWVRNLEMPEELREKWGYREVTREDKANILGLNLARLTGIEPTKRV